MFDRNQHRYCKAIILQLKINKFFLKKDSGDGDFPGGPVVGTLPSQCRFDSLVGKLRFHSHLDWPKINK